MSRRDPDNGTDWYVVRGHIALLLLLLAFWAAVIVGCIWLARL